MSTIYSSSYLKTLARGKTVADSYRMFSARKEKYIHFDIFLSHSYLDKDVIEGLYIELTQMGFKVYVDWIVDPELDRNHVDNLTATIIRNRLKSSEALLLAISTNATMSKWMPWELGYVDGNTNKCAIIPVSDNLTSLSFYKGTEYLSLYPFVKKAPTDKQKEILWVIKESDEYISFIEWLRGDKIFKRDRKIY